MKQVGFTRCRTDSVRRGLLLLATAVAGCSGQEYGAVPSTPKSPTEVAETAPAKVAETAPAKSGVSQAPRVPRGPGQAKALQEAKAK